MSIKEKSRIERGCLIGDGVTVGPHASLEPLERLSRKRTRTDGAALDKTDDKDETDDEEDDSDLEEAEASE